MAPQKFLSQATIAYGNALIAERLEESGDDFSNRFFVINDQYLGFGHPKPLKEQLYGREDTNKASSNELSNGVLDS
jgi:hypothetical protein